MSPAYTSVTFYTNKDVAYYAINDRAAGRRTIELDLMTSAQRAQLPDDEEIAAADRLIVESPSRTGLIVLRALAAEPGMMPAAISALSGARCEPQPRAISRSISKPAARSAFRDPRARQTARRPAPLPRSSSASD